MIAGGIATDAGSIASRAAFSMIQRVALAESSTPTGNLCSGANRNSTEMTQQPREIGEAAINLIKQLTRPGVPSHVMLLCHIHTAGWPPLLVSSARPMRRARHYAARSEVSPRSFHMYVGARPRWFRPEDH